MKAIDSAKKSKKGRPPVDSEAVNVRLHTDFLQQVDDWRAQQRPIPSRPEAIRRFSEIGLLAQPLLREFLNLVDEIIAEEGDKYEGQLDALKAHIRRFID